MLINRDRETHILNRYRAAYEAARGEPAPVITIQPHGWYQVEGRASKRRLADMEKWAIQLEQHHGN